MFLRWIGSGIFEEKLRSIINRVCADQTFLPRMPNGVYRDPASSGHLGDGKHAALSQPVEAALESVSLSNVANGC